ncbi:MAG: SLC13 family permease [Candidatus Marinimicrobia bacterium]|nr:SLC13 family permease [Candidatus Neomarinimicrobiota bacterium]
MDKIIVFSTLFVLLGLFAWGRIRHDFVALIGLFILVIAGIISPTEAFTGFGHPAVITVAAVLIIGKALENSGLVDILGKWVLKIGKNLVVQILTLSFLVAIASAFINNVGALAIMMPVAILMAKKSGNSASSILMPIAFASLLGGMTTLIGTPPNIIIATFRAEEVGKAFNMFSYTPVGLGVAIVGVLFISLLGWRLLPKRSSKTSKEELFNIDDYITELKVTKDSKVLGKSIGEVVKKAKSDVHILGLVRNKERIHAPHDKQILKVRDVIIVQTDSDTLKSFIANTQLELLGGRQFRKDATGSKDITISEVVVKDNSPLVGRTATSVKMRSTYGINLLAISRRDKRIASRLDKITFRGGDVLMLQGRTHMIEDVISSIGCLPLVQRGLRIGYQKRIAFSLGIFIAAIVLVLTGLLQVQIAFSIAAVIMVLSGLLPIKEIYSTIDWPIIVLLGAMIPVGQSLETTGGANLIASQILHLGNNVPPWAILTVVLVITMFLSDIINNAATVVLMAPVAMNVAYGLGTSLDPFLMAVAVGGSCAFLTPIGHQSNTLVMGPGGYKFSDYWRMGLPLEILIVLFGVPLILLFWPL